MAIDAVAAVDGTLAQADDDFYCTAGGRVAASQPVNWRTAGNGCRSVEGS